MKDLVQLTDEELAQRIIETLTDEESAAITCAAVIASAKGQSRPDVLTCRNAAALVGVGEETVCAFYGWLPLTSLRARTSRRHGWADVANGAHGPALVNRRNLLGLFAFRQLGGEVRAQLKFDSEIPAPLEN